MNSSESSAPRRRRRHSSGASAQTYRKKGARTPHVQPARRVAFDVLRAVSDSDAYANLLLPAALRNAGMSSSDAALATELTYGTLRNKGTYDAIIEVVARRPVGQIDPPALDAIRLGTHQLLATRVAPHAAVNESVAIVAAEVGRSATGFTNAILRRISEKDRDEWLNDLQQRARSDDERLSLRTAHPVWIIRAFRRALAAENRETELEALLDADNAAPEVTLVALPGLAEPGEPARPYARTAFGSPGGDPRTVIEAAQGRIRVQDEGSQLVAAALVAAAPPRSGERWLDLCAGPGGKTAILAAEALRHGATLDANEIVPARAGLVRQALEAVPLDVTVMETDGRAIANEYPAAYDRILVDAPCTGLGALRRRPEARWRKTPEDVPELVDVQEQLILSAIDALAPGGTLAYVTCSPHLAETVGVVQSALRARPDIDELDARAVIQKISSSPIDLATPSDGSGHAQLWPHRHGTDAMFLALLRKPPQNTKKSGR